MILSKLILRKKQTTDAPKPTEGMSSLRLKYNSMQDLRLSSAGDSAPGKPIDIKFVPLRALPQKAPSLCALVLKTDLSYKLEHRVLISNYLWTSTAPGHTGCYY